MRRLNVQFTQIEECIRKSLFALPALPRNPPLETGEALLLQLVVADARPMGKQRSRIEFALIFDRIEEDPTGEISRIHWPDADRTWRYILHCSETIPTIPFSLELLDLGRSYSSQNTAVHIAPRDEAKIRPYLKGEIPAADLYEVASVDDLLAAIRNHDRVKRLEPTRRAAVREHERRLADPWLSDALKRLYNHRCQICVHDFEPRWGVPYADTLQLGEGSSDPLVSTELAVVCPNHGAIVGAAGGVFDRRTFAFRFPNGLVEKLTLRDHLLMAS